MEYRNVRLDQLNFSSMPVRLRRSVRYLEQLKSSLEATGGPVTPLILRELGKSDQYISRLLAVFELTGEGMITNRALKKNIAL